MPRRASNRERIERRALEAAITAQEKTAEREVKTKKTAAKKAPPPPQRMKFVWKVFDGSFKEVACFPYPQEEQARAKAAALTAKTGKEHFVNSVKVPMAADE